MLCHKISANPRKGFLQFLDRGMNKIKKPIYFRTLRHSNFLFPSVIEFFTEKVVFLGHPNVHISGGSLHNKEFNEASLLRSSYFVLEGGGI